MAGLRLNNAYPWHELRNVGDSFSWPVLSDATTLRSQAHRKKITHGAVLRVHKDSEGGRVVVTLVGWINHGGSEDANAQDRRRRAHAAREGR